MLNFTPLCRPFFVAKAKSLGHHAENLEQTQRNVLRTLLHDARSTDIGRRYGFASVSDAEHYCSRVPLRPYEDIRAEVMRMVAGEKDVLWPGRCRALRAVVGHVRRPQQVCPRDRRQPEPQPFCRLGLLRG